MNTSSEAAEQIVRMSLEGFEVVVKVSGSCAKNITALLCAIIKNKEQTVGKTSLTKMLKSGKELKVFSVKQNEFSKFASEAKRYGILYTALRDKKNTDGIIDILVKVDDAPKINRIVKRFHLTSYDDIKSDDIQNELNPHLATTEKNPLSKPLSKMQETSDQGSKISNRTSVKDKLKHAKAEVREKSKIKNEVLQKKSIHKDKDSSR